MHDKMTKLASPKRVINARQHDNFWKKHMNGSGDGIWEIGIPEKLLSYALIGAKLTVTFLGNFLMLCGSLVVPHKFHPSTRFDDRHQTILYCLHRGC